MSSSILKRSLDLFNDEDDDLNGNIFYLYE
jgi:hypothetical protein